MVVSSIFPEQVLSSSGDIYEANDSKDQVEQPGSLER